MRRKFMKQSVGSKAAPDARRKGSPVGHKVHRDVMSHARSSLSSGKETELEPDQPFVEGARSTIDLDLRHRMVSEAAYRRYTERGYADGYDVDDWLQAEADVDHLLLYPGLQTAP